MISLRIQLHVDALVIQKIVNHSSTSFKIAMAIRLLTPSFIGPTQEVLKVGSQRAPAMMQILLLTRQTVLEIILISMKDPYPMLLTYM